MLLLDRTRRGPPSPRSDAWSSPNRPRPSRRTALPRRFLRWLPAAAAAVVALSAAGPAAADIAPPWCGTPEPDAAEALPSTGTSFPHIPYYAIGCTLADIQSRSLDGRMSLEVHGTSATGRPLYK